MVHTAGAVVVVDDVGQYMVNSRCVRSVQAAARAIRIICSSAYLYVWIDTWFLRGNPGFVGSRTTLSLSLSQGGRRTRADGVRLALRA